MIATEYDELDREFGDDDQPRSRGGAGLRILPILIGILSLLALGGIIWYAYSQGVREGSEDAAPLLRPVMEAKVPPTDPGGRTIAGTDLTVYGPIGEAEEDVTVERILPPPEEPTLPTAPLTAPGADISATTGQDLGTQPEIATPPNAAAGNDTETGSRGTIPAPGTQAVEALPELPEPSLAPPPAPPPTVGNSTNSAVASEQAAQPSAPAVQPETVVSPPPEQPASQAVASAAEQPAQQQTSSIDPSAAWHIQIAALKSDAAARAEWQTRQSAVPDLLGALSLVVQTVTVNGTQYFRVRGGPLGSSEAAKNLCAQLKGRGVDCLAIAPGK